jgi:nucleoside phosphorylase
MTRDRYDIAVLTVIQVEGEILSHWLKVAPASRIRRDGRIFHTANVFSEIHQRNLRVVVGCIGRASQADAALAAQFMFREFDPAVAVLCGIAAGLRGKVRIGDVVWSRQIVDLSQKVAQAGGYSERPGGALLHPLTQQMMANRRTDPALFLPGFAVRNGITIVPPAGKEAEYAEHVADAPTTHDAAIASADVLLRDGTMFRELLQLNQSIRAAEMEAGGFVKACQDGAKPRPWLVVRGISDFGDDFKDDAFHVLAAHSAAAFVSQFVRLAADIDLVRPQRARRSTVAQVQPSVGQTAGSNISSVSVSVAVTGVSSGIAAGSDTAGLRADFERARRD